MYIACFFRECVYSMVSLREYTYILKKQGIYIFPEVYE